MRIPAHRAPLVALLALGLGLGRRLREPDVGGRIFLLLLAAAAGLAARHLYRPRRPPRRPSGHRDASPSRRYGTTASRTAAGSHWL